MERGKGKKLWRSGKARRKEFQEAGQTLAHAEKKGNAYTLHCMKDKLPWPTLCFAKAPPLLVRAYRKLFQQNLEIASNRNQKEIDLCKQISGKYNFNWKLSYCYLVLNGVNMTARLKESYEWGCRIFRLDIRKAISRETQNNDKVWQALARIKVPFR